MAEQKLNWRQLVTREYRDEIRRNVLDILDGLYDNTPAETLKCDTRILESNSYSTATSHTDYLERITAAVQSHAEKCKTRRLMAELVKANFANHRAQASLCNSYPNPVSEMQSVIPASHQVLRNDAQVSDSPHPSDRTGTSMDTPISRFGGRATQGGSSRVSVGYNQTSLRCGTTTPHGQLNETLRNGPSFQVDAGASSSACCGWNALPGVAVPQMQQFTRHRQGSLSTRLAGKVLAAEKYGDLAENENTAPVLQVSSRGQSSKQVHFAGDGYPRVPHVSGAVTVEQKPLPAESVQLSPTVHNAPASASKEAIWAKLEQMQRDYRDRLQELLPIIHNLQGGLAPGCTNLFMRRVEAAMNLLNYTRTTPNIERLPMELLGKIEMFISEVVDVHTRYLHSTENSD